MTVTMIGGYVHIPTLLHQHEKLEIYFYINNHKPFFPFLQGEWHQLGLHHSIAEALLIWAQYNFFQAQKSAL